MYAGVYVDSDSAAVNTFTDYSFERVRDAFQDMYGDLDDMLSRFNGGFAAEVRIESAAE